MSEPTPIGRDKQAAQLLAAADAARAGSARAVVVSGGPGSGKSLLLDQLDRALAPDALVLRASGHPAEADLPYAALHQLLGPIEGSAQDLVTELASGTLADPMTVASSVLRVLTEIAERRLVVVLVDDAQWIDPSSRQALIFASRRLDADAVCVCICVHEEHDADFSPLGEVVRLPPLDVPAAREVLRTRHPDLADVVARRIVEQSGGLPLALTEIPAELSAEQRSGSVPLPRRLPIGRRLHRLYDRRLAEVGPHARAALLLLSIDPMDAGTTARALQEAGRSPADLDAVERAGLARMDGGRCRLSHPTVRLAIEAAATATELRNAHAVIARVTDDPVRRARHLHEASIEPDPAVGAALVDAARRTMARHGYAEAAGLWEAAAEHAESRQEREDRRTEAAECHVRVGSGRAALTVLSALVEDAATEVDRARFEQMSVVTAMWANLPRPDDYAPLSSFAERLIAEDEPARSAGRDLLRAMAMDCLTTGEYGTGKRFIDLIRRSWSGDLPLSTNLLGDCFDVMVGAPGGGDVLRSDWLDELSEDELADPSSPVIFVGIVLGWMDDVPRCRALADAHERALRAERGRNPVRNAVRAIRGRLAELEGDWTIADLELAAAAQTALESDFVGPYPYMALRHAYLSAMRGDTGRSARLRESAAGYAVDKPLSVRHLTACVEGMEHLVEGRYQEAAAVLASGGAIETEMGSVPSGYTSRFGDWFEAMWRADRGPETVRELAAFEAAAQVTGQPTDLATAARCRAALCDDAEVDEAFGAAMAQHAESPNVFEAARTQLSWGRRLRRARRKGDATAHLSAALEVFERLGARPWSDQARSELAACGQRRAATPSAAGPLSTLTPREYEVAQLVGAGATNAEAAEQLFISIRTVEYHLANTYRKLGVSDRRDLAAVVL